MKNFRGACLPFVRGQRRASFLYEERLRGRTYEQSLEWHDGVVVVRRVAHIVVDVGILRRRWRPDAVEAESGHARRQLGR